MIACGANFAAVCCMGATAAEAWRIATLMFGFGGLRPIIVPSSAIAMRADACDDCQMIRAINPSHDAAYRRAALSAILALYRALMEKGLLSREGAVRFLLEEGVAGPTRAEAQSQEGGPAPPPADINRQSAEILKFI